MKNGKATLGFRMLKYGKFLSVLLELFRRVLQTLKLGGVSAQYVDVIPEISSISSFPGLE